MSLKHFIVLFISFLAKQKIQKNCVLHYFNFVTKIFKKIEKSFVHVNDLFYYLMLCGCVFMYEPACMLRAYVCM